MVNRFVNKFYFAVNKYLKSKQDNNIRERSKRKNANQELKKGNAEIYQKTGKNNGQDQGGQQGYPLRR